MKTPSITPNCIGIIHLSDIHFALNNNHIFDKSNKLFQALKDNFLNCSCIYIVVSGDIANTGNTLEYNHATEFLSNLIENLRNRWKMTQFKFVIVPGNHDCNIETQTQTRINLIKTANYQTIGEDDSVIKSCLEVQTSFWHWYANYSDEPANKLYYRITDNIRDKNICFHCFNTAWMSTVPESPGHLFFPVKLVKNKPDDCWYDLNISVYHHPQNWLNPNTPENNKNEFIHFMEEISSIQIVGHEHGNELHKSENIDIKNSQSYCITSDVLQDRNNNTISGFQTFTINLETNKTQLRRYRWQDNLFIQYADNELLISGKTTKPLDVNQSFIDSINKIGIPLGSNSQEIKLTDIFVFPDLEKLTAKSQDKIDDFIDSSTLLDVSAGNNILEGDSQIGKTSLLAILYIKSIEKGLFPIFINGKDISSDNVDKLIQKAFKQQYSDAINAYDIFRQLDNSRKVLLIDDLHLSKLPKSVKHSVVLSLLELFPHSIITIDTAYSILPQNQSEFKDITPYSIKPLGYKKSGDLVDKYLRLKEPVAGDVLDTHFDNSKHRFNQVRQIIGDKLIPSYPIYVLSIAQALDFTAVNLNETSYAYCYQTLIHHALNSAGVVKDDIGDYMNILTNLAYHIFDSRAVTISEDKFENFYSTYKNRFHAPSFNIAKTCLCASKILRIEQGCVSFGYKYILYFLAAKKIAEIIETKEGKAIIKHLYDNLYKEDNANILVFITHHSKSDSFIQEAILTAMLPFEKTIPITLEKNCQYNKLLQEIVEEIKQNVIEMNRDPLEERKKQLLEQDRLERQTSKELNEDSNEQVDEGVVPFIQAFRSIEIVGQIIRNRKGSIEKPVLKEMLTELYITGFRMIGYIGEMFQGAKDELIKRIEEKVTKDDTNQEIEMKIYRFIQFVSLQSCLSVFSKFIHSVGMRNFRELYESVANDIGSPAAKIVSFSITSYYGKINMRELEKLAKEFEGNLVAMQILRARVKAYVYNNYVDYKDKQKISSYLKMKSISATVGHRSKGY